jgi:hypothetical protein
VRVQKSNTTLKELREEDSTPTASKLSSQPRARTQGLLDFIERGIRCDLPHEPSEPPLYQSGDPGMSVLAPLLGAKQA